MVSLSLAPTWKVTDGGAAQQADAVEHGGVADARDLGRQLVDLGLDGALAGGRERAVAVLDGQLADALQDAVDLVEVALCGLHHGHAVLDVALSLGEAADLAAHLLGDAETSCVVGRLVDAEARREPLHRLGDRVGRCRQMTVGRMASTLELMRRDIGGIPFLRSDPAGGVAARRSGHVGELCGGLRRRGVLSLDGRPDLLAVHGDGPGCGDADAHGRAGDLDHLDADVVGDSDLLACTPCDDEHRNSSLENGSGRVHPLAPSPAAGRAGHGRGRRRSG